MRQAERKRSVGYQELVLTTFCGNCRRCVRKGTHLICEKFAFPVQATAICRSGWEAHDAPLTAQDHPLLVKSEEDHPIGSAEDMKAFESFVKNEEVQS